MPPARRGRASDALDGMVSSATPSPSVRRRGKSPARGASPSKSTPSKSTRPRPAHYGAQSFVDISRERTAWLLGFLCVLLVSANIMKSFSELLKDEIELTFFVSMLIGHGGNSGGQTVSAVIRALGSGQVTPRDAGRTVAKETAASFCQSVALAAVVVPALLAMGITRRVTAVVALALPALGVLANGLGSALPFMALQLGHDPAVVVSPLMTTLTDMLGTLTFLGLASMIIAILP